jgi:hypothetical protein
LLDIQLDLHQIRPLLQIIHLLHLLPPMAGTAEMVDFSISSQDNNSSKAGEAMASAIIILLSNHLYQVLIPPKRLSFSLGEI